ncbi:hypothetical protein SDRG_06667 [Saprolegnia diclina VS20]|uniref:Replication factor A C-terminal domain-containing protein n=1 Tax=Saprolegnia diclina (strain VS20) TaxID=1156394 RepID=T0QMJ7_SAPDV|nr:hypothetical protein SDRG_06667 [Saprolegnia diclina VS20]EQC35921.1 hypothetical protein SDRG_06667 [Saprolegnia diclina VS20]|eukprot:XP_008610683.1 hypothetical protein SDRG_06667 [Saprolegnia diclina VS20]
MQANLVPSALIERADTKKMLYRACGLCKRVVPGDQRPYCRFCNVSLHETTQVIWRYKLVLSCAIGMTLLNVILFDEVAEVFLGAPASRYAKLREKLPSLDAAVAETLEGSLVEMTLQESAVNSATGYEREPKAVRIAWYGSADATPLLTRVLQRHYKDNNVAL